MTTFFDHVSVAMTVALKIYQNVYYDIKEHYEIQTLTQIHLLAVTVLGLIRTCRGFSSGSETPMYVQSAFVPPVIKK